MPGSGIDIEMLVMEYCVLVLPSVHDVMKAEKLLLKSGLSINIIAAPRAISFDCGVVIQFNCACLDEVVQAVKELSVEKKFFKKESNAVYSPVTQE